MSTLAISDFVGKVYSARRFEFVESENRAFAKAGLICAAFQEMRADPDNRAVGFGVQMDDGRVILYELDYVSGPEAGGIDVWVFTPHPLTADSSMDGFVIELYND